MGWYDFFSLTYDSSLEKLYRPYRIQVVEALKATPGAIVLDLACGTGQNFDLVVDAIGAHGRLVGVDLSTGMLRQAQKRIDRVGWKNVTLLQGDALALTHARLAEDARAPVIDRVMCTLGLSAMPDWEGAFQRSYGLLRPGGRYVILDVHAEKRIFQTRLVEWMARADLSRKVWEPLQRQCPDFQLKYLEASPGTFGGGLLVAQGTKPT